MLLRRHHKMRAKGTTTTLQAAPDFTADDPTRTEAGDGATPDTRIGVGPDGGTVDPEHGPAQREPQPEPVDDAVTVSQADLDVIIDAAREAYPVVPPADPDGVDAHAGGDPAPVDDADAIVETITPGATGTTDPEPGGQPEAVADDGSEGMPGTVAAEQTAVTARSHTSRPAQEKGTPARKGHA